MCLSVCILWGIKTGYQNGLFHRLWNMRDLNVGCRAVNWAVLDTETIPTEGVPFSTDLCALAEVDDPATGKEDKTFYEAIYGCATPPRLIPRAKPRQP